MISSCVKAFRGKSPLLSEKWKMEIRSLKRQKIVKKRQIRLFKFHLQSPIYQRGELRKYHGSIVWINSSSGEGNVPMDIHFWLVDYIICAYCLEKKVEWKQQKPMTEKCRGLLLFFLVETKRFELPLLSFHLLSFVCPSCLRSIELYCIKWYKNFILFHDFQLVVIKNPCTILVQNRKRGKVYG